MTGSGKTLAFLIPAFQLLLKKNYAKNEVGVLVVSPTRELATQIHKVAQAFKPFVKKAFSLQCTIGGTSIDEDLQRIKEEGAHIWIGTPGRTNDLLNKLAFELNVKELDLLIFDEADRLLDMGFETTLTAILHKLPKNRHTGLFSATMTDAIGELVRVGLRNPVKITVQHHEDQLEMEDQQTPFSLNTSYQMLEADQKLVSLVSFLQRHGRTSKIMVYFCTCACVDYFQKLLLRVKQLAGTKIYALHGRMVPKRRTGEYENLCNSKAAILLCTDITARGIDIPEIDWVVQYDPPQDPKVFVHRVGRTARLGRSGNALVFLQPHEDLYIGECSREPQSQFS